MSDVNIRYETAPVGAELSLSGGRGQWIDDAIASAAVIIIVSVLGSRAYRWAKAQGGHPREVVETKVHHIQEAGSAAVRAWRGGDHSSELLTADDGGDLQQPVSVASRPER